jgi:hypothetical protein
MNPFAKLTYRLPLGKSPVPTGKRLFSSQAFEQKSMKQDMLKKVRRHNAYGRSKQSSLQALEEFDMKFNWKHLDSHFNHHQFANWNSFSLSDPEIISSLSHRHAPLRGRLWMLARIAGPTPSVWEAVIYEMGLCTAHPFGTSKDGVTFDASTCTVTYTDTKPISCRYRRFLSVALSL